MQPSSVLDIIVIIYYLPVLIASFFVLRTHGFSREAGWLALTLLSILRLMGSSAGIAAEYDPSVAAITVSLVFSNVGTISLIAALTGIIKRVINGLSQNGLSQRLLRLSAIPLLVAVILFSLGGSRSFSSDPSTQSSGHTMSRVAILLLAAIYIFDAFLCVYAVMRSRYVLEADRRLLHVCVIALPFVLVRIVYALLLSFDSASSNFSILSNTDAAIIIKAIMGILMEFIVAGLFLWAGLTVDGPAKKQQQQHQQGQDQEQKYEYNNVQQQSGASTYQPTVQYTK